MPREKNLVTAIREFVRSEIGDVLASIFGTSTPKSRRRRGKGKWRPGGPGRPPKKVAARRKRKKK